MVNPWANKGADWTATIVLNQMLIRKALAFVCSIVESAFLHRTWLARALDSLF